MAGDYAVRVVMMENGERLPMLWNRRSGVPLFEPTVYTLTNHRQTNRASNTIERVLREIEILLLFLDFEKIDLSKRMGEGNILSISEIDALVRLCSLPVTEFSSLYEYHEPTSRKSAPTSGNVLKLARRRLLTPGTGLAHVTVANRIRSIQAYLNWLVDKQLSQHAMNNHVNAELTAAKMIVSSALAERIGAKKGRNTIGLREGASPEALARMLDVINPLSSENPWLSPHSRVRNSLAVCWLLRLGFRRGELLNVKISDVNFRTNVVTIARRPDDPSDRRGKQPRTKTRDRKVPLSPELAAATAHYITKIRNKIEGARKHEFLFVADRTGNELSLDAMNKVFRVLREKVPGLPDDLTPHILRHSWNDEFSDKADKKGLLPDDEKKFRSYLMGWAETSDTAMTYTRRHIRLKAQQVSLEMQNEMMGKKNER